MSRWSTFVAASLVGSIVLVACHNTPREASSFSRRVGVYRFSEQIHPPNDVSSEVVHLDGEFVVLEDTVTVETTTGVCHLNMGVPRANIISYECGDVTVAFDRTNPVEGATYTTVLKFTAYQQVCVRYATDSQGRQTCAQMSTEAVQRQEVERGHIRGTRVSSGGS